MMWKLCIFTFLIAFGGSQNILEVLKKAYTHPITQMAATDKQLGGGLSALGTLVSPLLFLMGMGSFISMLPQMFQSVLSGVGSNLIQSFTGANAASGGTPSSSRLRRSLPTEDDILNEIERRFNLAVLKYEGHIGV
ncbi:hypothetical protein HNY73_004943 [Argiope bruennichi]|uniref:Uncharacterized protein n=1 Tax=Argiope bruennichi TaxID=94029 RepID=A0A8T0FRL6_ARGBR|nr:hypothetical protein HNY73_004943 [Argiope bruennichi]